jgi:hypothetical protein
MLLVVICRSRRQRSAMPGQSWGDRFRCDRGVVTVEEACLAAAYRRWLDPAEVDEAVGRDPPILQFRSPRMPRIRHLGHLNCKIAGLRVNGSGAGAGPAG